MNIINENKQGTMPEIGFIVSDELRSLQRVELDLLKELKIVCKKYNIIYYATGETLISAVRHQGFIPWDDDCDLTMLRHKYNKFVFYCNSHKNKLIPYKLIDHFNTKEYSFGIARFCDTRF